MPHYSESQMQKALETYHDLKSVSRTVQKLGYPTRTQLYKWIHGEGKTVEKQAPRKYKNTPSHPRNPSANVKLEAIQRCFENGEKVVDVARQIGYTTASIYHWRRLYLTKGALALRNTHDVPRGPLKEGDPGQDSAELEALKAKILDLEMDVAILKETITIIKKDPGVDDSALKNREKTEVVNALKSRFGLSRMLRKMKLPRSVYYYDVKHANDKIEKDENALKFVSEAFEKAKRRYGYRRIRIAIRDHGKIISEKVIQRVMKDNNLVVCRPKKRKYSSYRGEITPAVPNILNRDFHADKPNEKWLTDITEFALCDGKLYLSPIIDCFDGRPVSWTIGESPNAELVNRMLDKAIAILHKGEKPVVHTDRGCHYRWPSWIKRMQSAGLVRSMSKKGCSPDNSACEGFFGIVKNEVFYNRDLSNVTRREFKKELNEYLKWFCKERIKMGLGGMSPDNYRKSLNLTT